MNQESFMEVLFVKWMFLYIERKTKNIQDSIQLREQNKK